MLIIKSFNFEQMAQIFSYIIFYIFNFPKITKKTEKNRISDLDQFTSEPFILYVDPQSFNVA